MTRTLFALLLVAVPVLGAAQSGAPVRKPEIRVGDSWTYRSMNLLGPGTDEHVTRVSFATDKVILTVSVRKSDAKEFDASWTSDWNAATSYSGSTYRPPATLLQFPMRVGDKHSFKLEVLPARSGTVMFHATGEATVTGWEMVDVPAGKFRALKVEAEAVWVPTDGSRTQMRKFTFWYSPEVRRWVKLHASWAGGWSGEELVEYTLNEN